MPSLSPPTHTYHHRHNQYHHEYKHKHKHNNQKIGPSFPAKKHSPSQKICHLQRLWQDPSIPIWAIALVQAIKPCPVRRRARILWQQRLQEERDQDAASLGPELAAEAAVQQSIRQEDQGAADGEGDEDD